VELFRKLILSSESTLRCVTLKYRNLCCTCWILTRAARSVKTDWRTCVGHSWFLREEKDQSYAQGYTLTWSFQIYGNERAMRKRLLRLIQNFLFCNRQYKYRRKAVSRRPPTAEARVRSLVSPCGTWDGQSDTGTDFSPSTSVFPCQFHATGALLGKKKKLIIIFVFITGLYNKP
jgi:hypothetical protein